MHGTCCSAGRRHQQLCSHWLHLLAAAVSVLFGGEVVEQRCSRPASRTGTCSLAAGCRLRCVWQEMAGAGRMQCSQAGVVCQGLGWCVAKWRQCVAGALAGGRAGLLAAGDVFCQAGDGVLEPGRPGRLMEVQNWGWGSVCAGVVRGRLAVLSPVLASATGQQYVCTAQSEVLH